VPGIEEVLATMAITVLCCFSGTHEKMNTTWALPGYSPNSKARAVSDNTPLSLSDVVRHNAKADQL